MTDYQGPERRSVVTFTREDSDRLVRIEESVKTVPDLVKRVEKVESKLSCYDCVFTAFLFVI